MSGPSSTGRGWPKVAIVVLNWNGWQDTVECLESLQKVTYPNYRIIVVDNGSTDQSVDRIKLWAAGKLLAESKYVTPDPTTKPVHVIEYSREQAEGGGIRELEDMIASMPSSRALVLIKTGKNLGFSGGNNVGIRYALLSNAEFVLLLNNDTVVSSDFLHILVDYALQVPDAGLIGPKILRYEDGAYPQWPLRERLTFTSLLFTLTPMWRLARLTPFYHSFYYRGEEPSPVYVVWGSCMLFRRSCLERIGLLDEKTFVYWEELILAERMRRLNIRTYIQPKAVIYHKSGRSLAKLGASRYIATVIAGDYFASQYLGLRRWQRNVLKMVRLIAYVGLMFGDTDYFRKFPVLLRALRGGLTTNDPRSWDRHQSA